jgi:hypothetical protein
MTLAIAVAIPLSVVATAGAEKPDCGDDPSHPACKPVDTTTTTAAPVSAGMCGGEVIGPDEATFEISLTGEDWVGCRDVEWPAATWAVDAVSVSGRVNTLTISVRDAIPGDWCAARQHKKPSSGWLADWEIPAAVVNGCGIDPGQFDDAHPALAFMASFQGGRDGAITLRVTRAD